MEPDVRQVSRSGISDVCRLLTWSLALACDDLGIQIMPELIVAEEPDVRLQPPPRAQPARRPELIVAEETDVRRLGRSGISNGRRLLAWRQQLACERVIRMIRDLIGCKVDEFIFF